MKRIPEAKEEAVEVFSILKRDFPNLRFKVSVKNKFTSSIGKVEDIKEYSAEVDSRDIKK